MAYAGTIIVEKDFALFAKVLAEIRAGIRLPITLEFFGAHSYRARPWFDASWMREHGNLPDPLVRAITGLTDQVARLEEQVTALKEGGSSERGAASGAPLKLVEK